MSRSNENLEAAFAGESKANRRYLAFARKAEKEGYKQVAKLFRAAAEAETVHALNHLRIMGEIRSTAQNLDSAASGETFEFKKMYPRYLKTAQQEGEKQAAWSFNVANKVEEIHAGLFKKAFEAVRNNQDSEATSYYVCGVCGNTVENAPPERCQICGAQKKEFLEVA